MIDPKPWVKENCQQPNKIKKSKEKSNFNIELGGKPKKKQCKESS